MDGGPFAAEYAHYSTELDRRCGLRRSRPRDRDFPPLIHDAPARRFCAVGSIEKLMTRSAKKRDEHNLSGGLSYSAAAVWGALVPHVVHPAKVAAIEAMLWMEQPLSCNQLVNLFDRDDLYLSLVSYHVGQLVKFGVLQRTGSCQRRGATETFYFFPEGAAHP